MNLYTVSKGVSHAHNLNTKKHIPQDERGIEPSEIKSESY